MNILIGLGNPGNDYQLTRHNVGFMVIDEVVKAWGGVLQSKPKFKAVMWQTPQVLCAQPQTFMNESGQAAQLIVRFYGALPGAHLGSYPNLFVIHDDLDIVLGEYKIQFGRGPKVHNGLQSIYQSLGSDQFWHVRVGVDSRGGMREVTGRDYVLTSFSPPEKALLDTVIAQILAKLDKLQTGQEFDAS